MLHEHLTATELSDGGPELAAAQASVRSFNVAYSGRISLLQRFRDAPFLLRVYWRRLSSRLVIPLAVIFIMYFLSPVDVLPEGQLGFLGFADDLLLFLGFCVLCSISLRAHIVNQQLGA